MTSIGKVSFSWDDHFYILTNKKDTVSTYYIHREGDETSEDKLVRKVDNKVVEKIKDADTNEGPETVRIVDGEQFTGVNPIEDEAINIARTWWLHLKENTTVDKDSIGIAEYNYGCLLIAASNGDIIPVEK